MNNHFFTIKKNIFLTLFLVFTLTLFSNVFSYTTCDISTIINNSNAPGGNLCTANSGLSIQNLNGEFYCAQTSDLADEFEFKSLQIQNSNISFVNCEFKSYFTSINNITIENSTLKFYGSTFDTITLEENVTLELLNSSNSATFFDVKTFDIYYGTNSTPLFVNSNDIKRNFEVINSSSGNFSNTLFSDNLFYVTKILSLRKLFDLYLPTKTFSSGIETNISNNSYSLQFDLSNNQSTIFNYTNFASITQPTEIQLVDSSSPNILSAYYTYNYYPNTKFLNLEFDELIQNLNISITNSTGQTVYSEQNISGIQQYSSSLLSSSFNRLEDYGIVFEFTDYFSNNDVQSIVFTHPLIINSTFGTYFYNFTQHNSVELNGTLRFVPQMNSYFNFFEFPITNTLNSTLHIVNDSINISQNIFNINTTSNFYQSQRVFINPIFDTAPIVDINGGSLFQTQYENSFFIYNSPIAISSLEVLNNSYIELNTSSPRYFGLSFPISVNYLQTQFSSVINPSSCSLTYNLGLSSQSIINLTYDVGSGSHLGSINFTEYLPLSKEVEVFCSNSLGFENLTQRFLVNHTAQPIDDFTSDISFVPKNLGSLTTTTKILQINISSNGLNNTNISRGNEYFVMISSYEYLRENGHLAWNTTQNLTPWISIGKNEQVIFSHNDSQYSKQLQMELENSSVEYLNNSFIFRDMRDEFNQGTSLFTIIRSCVPGNICSYFSNDSRQYIFQDSTPPLVYNFSFRNITNNEQFQMHLNLDDLESDVESAQLILINSNNNSENIYLDFTNYRFNNSNIVTIPFTNSNLIQEGIKYNVSIYTNNLNNISTIYNFSQKLLLDNKESVNSTLTLVNTSIQNTTPTKFYVSNNSNILLNITTGFDNFSSYSYNSGIDSFNMSIHQGNIYCTPQNLTYNYSQLIVENTSQILNVNITQNSCNSIMVSIQDKAGNTESVTPLHIVSDNTPPVFNLVQSLTIAPKGSNSKIFNVDQITNETDLFGYEFDLSDNLSYISKIFVNLYERNNLSSAFNLVKRFELGNETKEIDFTLSNYTFKDGASYQIGVIGENYASVQTSEEISSATFLTLTKELNISISGLFRKNESHFYYGKEFLKSNFFNISYENNNNAEISCSISNESVNYNQSDVIQCSSDNNFSSLSCSIPNTLIENSSINASIFMNCFVQNSNDFAQKYYSAELKFKHLVDIKTNISFAVLDNLSNVKENQSLRFKINQTDKDNETTYIIQKELLVPANSIQSLIYQEKGENISQLDLEDSINSIFKNTVEFIFDNTQNTSELNISFNETTEITEFNIEFNSTISQLELEQLFENYFILNNNLKIFKNIEFELSSNISSSFSILDNQFNTSKSYINNLINSEKIQVNLNGENSIENISNQNQVDINLSNFNSNITFNSENTLELVLENYFTNVTNQFFNFNISYLPRDLKLNSSINSIFGLSPNNRYIINASELIINENDVLNISNSISTQVITNSAELSFRVENSSTTRNDFVYFNLNTPEFNNISTFQLNISDNYNSSVIQNITINWIPSVINESTFNLSSSSLSYPSLFNVAESYFYINNSNILYVFDNISFSISNSSIQNKNFEEGYYNLSYLELSELYSNYLNNNSNYTVEVSYQSVFGFNLNKSFNVSLEFDFDEDGIPDLIDIDRDNDGINDSNDSILYYNTLVFGTDLSSNVSMNVNTSNQSVFNISSTTFNSSVLISWEDNNSEIWDFTYTKIRIENKTFQNNSLGNGSRIVVENFPEFNSNKSISLPILSNSSELVYCIKDAESNQTSPQCDGPDEYILSSCNTSLGNGISCIEENKLWKILNLRHTVVEEVCIENWIVGAWSSCSSGTQTRSVTANHSCGSEYSKPTESRSCSSSGGSSGGGGSSSRSSSSSSSSSIIPSTSVVNSTSQENKTTTPIIPLEDKNNSNEEVSKPTVIITDSTNENQQSTNEDKPQITIPQEEIDFKNTPKSSSQNLWMYILVGVLVLVIIIVLIVLFKNKKMNSQKPEQIIVTPTPYVNEKSILNFSSDELNEVHNTAHEMFKQKQPISEVAKKYKVKSINEISKLLIVVDFETFTQYLKSELNTNVEQLGTVKMIEKLNKEEWFNAFYPSNDTAKYFRDIGFFISQTQLTYQFNTQELKEIFIDLIEEDLNK